MLWRHACGCGGIAAQIAKNVRENPDDLYLAGLFHDVGKTVVLSLLDTIAVRSRQAALRPEFVDLVLAEHHQMAGREVVKRWELPEQVAEAVRCHTETPGVTLTRVQAIVALANNCCRRLEIGVVDDGRPIAGPGILAAFGAAEIDVPAMVEGVPEAVGLD